METLDTAQLEKRSLRDMDVVSLFHHDKEQTTQQSQVQQQLKTIVDADKHNKSERLEAEKTYLNVCISHCPVNICDQKFNNIIFIFNHVIVDAH